MEGVNVRAYLAANPPNWYGLPDAALLYGAPVILLACCTLVCTLPLILCVLPTAGVVPDAKCMRAFACEV